MGLFNKLLPGRAADDAPFDTRDAVAGILLSTIASDGHISDDEADSFKIIVNRMKLFREQSGQQFNAMIDKLFGLMGRIGSSELLDRCVPALSQEMRQTAFAVAADLVFADGHVEDEEQALLEDLQEKLDIPEELALRIVEVIVIKNRG